MAGQTKKRKNNISRFRQDRRLLVVGALQALALLLMLGTVVFCIVQYQDRLNLNSLRQGVAYLKAAASREGAAEFSLELERDSVYRPFGFGIASVSKDGYRYTSSVSANNYHALGSYSQPALAAGDRTVLVYDRGGTAFSVMNSYATVYSETLDSVILSGSMNRAGAFSIVTNESGYRSAVAVYSAKQKLLCKWLTSQYYVMLTSISPDSRDFAALCFSQSEGTLRTQALLFHIGEETAFATLELSGRNVCSMKYDNSGNLFILCEDGLELFDKTGKSIYHETFSQTLTDFSHEEGQLPLMIFTAADAGGEQVQLRMLNSDGSVRCDAAYSGTYLAAAANGSRIHLLLSDRLVTVDTGSGSTSELAQSGARGVLAASDGNPILLYSDRGEKPELSKTLKEAR